MIRFIGERVVVPLVVLLTLAVLALHGGLFSTSGSPPTARAQTSTIGEWAPAQDWTSVAVHTTLLPTGKVMYYSYGDDARQWDPATRSIRDLARAGYNIFCTGHSLLGDGRLFVTGGHIENGKGDPRARTYDPSNDQWASVPNMNAGRWYPSNTTLDTGEVLVSAGTDQAGVQNPLPQVYQPASNTWRNLTGAQRELPYYPFMFVTPNGAVFNAGPNQDTKYLKTAGTGAWTTEGLANGGLRNFGFRDYGSAAMYADGKVLVVGGTESPDASAEVINLNGTAATWQYTGSLASPRRQHNATLLPDGTVLVTGGSSGPGVNNASYPAYTAELWDPASGTWATLAKNTKYRGYHSTAFLLPDGRVVSAGGDNQPNAEVFSPPYLFKGTRPTITSAPSSVSYGQSFSIGTSATDIAKVTLLRLASVTHAFDENQRITFLAFSQAAGGLTVTAPASASLSPPGHYLLFILNSSGVPSVAEIVHVGGSGAPTPTPTPSRTATPTPSATVTPTAGPSATPTPAVGGPPAPSNLTATALSAMQVQLNWKDNATNEVGFRIERCQGGNCTNFSEIVTVGANVSTYQDSGLKRNTFYRYRVRAYHASGTSTYSNIASVRTMRS